VSVSTIGPTARRVTVIAPTTRVDVSLPQQSTLAELVPTLVRMAAGEPNGAGWTLGRLGSGPLDASSTVAGAGIRDGELLYLNPRGAKPMSLVLDDVVDAIATTAAEPRWQWRPGLTRAVGLAVALVTFGGAGVFVAATRQPWQLGAVIDGLLAVVLLLGATALARTVDPWAGTTVAVAGIPAALLAGIALGVPAGANPFVPGAPALAAGCAVLAIYALVCAGAMVEGSAWFIGVAIASGVGLFAAVITAASGVTATSVAAVVAAIALAISPLLPVSALRIGRLPMPRVPTDVAAFRREDPPIVGADLPSRTRVASDALAGLLAAVSLVVVTADVVLVRSSDAWGWALAGLSGLAMLLRARAYPRAIQRGSLVAGGVVALMVAAPGLALSGPSSLRPALIAGLAGLGVIGVAYGVRSRANQPSPYWTRLLDVLEVLAVVSLVPLAAGVLGLYRTARGLGG
jgi:type VII secretion integral membrane protein EccD